MFYKQHSNLSYSKMNSLPRSAFHISLICGVTMAAAGLHPEHSCMWYKVIPGTIKVGMAQFRMDLILVVIE